jgi:hypothetical protein
MQLRGQLNPYFIIIIIFFMIFPKQRINGLTRDFNNRLTIVLAFILTFTLALTLIISLAFALACSLLYGNLALIINNFLFRAFSYSLRFLINLPRLWTHAA